MMNTVHVFTNQRSMKSTWLCDSRWKQWPTDLTCLTFSAWRSEWQAWTWTTVGGESKQKGGGGTGDNFSKTISRLRWWYNEEGYTSTSCVFLGVNSLSTDILVCIARQKWKGSSSGLKITQKLFGSQQWSIVVALWCSGAALLQWDGFIQLPSHPGIKGLSSVKKLRLQDDSHKYKA